MQQVCARAAVSLLSCWVHCLVGAWVAQAVGGHRTGLQLSATDCWGSYWSGWDLHPSLVSGNKRANGCFRKGASKWGWKGEIVRVRQGKEEKRKTTGTWGREERKKKTVRKEGNKSMANSEQEECLLPWLPWPCWPSSPEASTSPPTELNWTALGHSAQLFPVPQQSLTLTYLAEGKVCRSGDSNPPGLPLPLHSEGTDPSQHQCLLFPTQVSLGRRKVISFKGSLGLCLCCFLVWSVQAELIQCRQREGKGDIRASRCTVSHRGTTGCGKTRWE